MRFDEFLTGDKHAAGATARVVHAALIRRENFDQDADDPRRRIECWAASTDSWNVELWPDPVETQKLLQKISAKIRKYIVLRPEALIATALWTMTAWAHEGATHSPILAAISVEPDSGKSTLLGVLRFLVPKPLSASNRLVPAYTVQLIGNIRP